MQRPSDAIGTLCAIFNGKEASIAPCEAGAVVDHIDRLERTIRDARSKLTPEDRSFLRDRKISRCERCGYLFEGLHDRCDDCD